MDAALKKDRLCFLTCCLLFALWHHAPANAQTFGNVVMGGGYVTGIISCPSQQNLFYGCRQCLGDELVIVQNFANTNQLSIPPNAASASVFYRLVSP